VLDDAVSTIAAMIVGSLAHSSDGVPSSPAPQT